MGVGVDVAVAVVGDAVVSGGVATVGGVEDDVEAGVAVGVPVQSDVSVVPSVESEESGEPGVGVAVGVAVVVPAVSSPSVDSVIEAPPSTAGVPPAPIPIGANASSRAPATRSVTDFVERPFID